MGRNYWSLAVRRGRLDTSYRITFGAGCLSFSVPSGLAGYEIESLFHRGPRLTLRSRLKSDNIFPALKKNKEIELTVTGRRTGKPLPRPVWFVLRGTELLLLPVTGADSQWYKNVLVNPLVEISAAQRSFNGNLRLITQKRVLEEVIDLFRGKYGPSDIKKYYPKPNVAAS